MRVEYLKTRARARRAQEEVRYIQEERHRILLSLEYTALVWDRRESQAAHIPGVSCPIIQQGLAAYAAKQARIRRGLADKFKVLWNTAASTETSRGGEEADSIQHSNGIQHPNTTGENEGIMNHPNDDLSEYDSDSSDGDRDFDDGGRDDGDDGDEDYVNMQIGGLDNDDMYI